MYVFSRQKLISDYQVGGMLKRGLWNCYTLHIRVFSVMCIESNYIHQVIIITGLNKLYHCMAYAPCPLSRFSWRTSNGRLTYVRKIGLVDMGLLLTSQRTRVVPSRPTAALADITRQKRRTGDKSAQWTRALMPTGHNTSKLKEMACPRDVSENIKHIYYKPLSP